MMALTKMEIHHCFMSGTIIPCLMLVYNEPGRNPNTHRRNCYQCLQYKTERGWNISFYFRFDWLKSSNTACLTENIPNIQIISFHWFVEYILRKHCSVQFGYGEIAHWACFCICEQTFNLGRILQTRDFLDIAWVMSFFLVTHSWVNAQWRILILSILAPY